MMNKQLFSNRRDGELPAANTLNSELAPAYAFSAKHALAQYASTGCLNQTFYASAELQLEQVLKLADAVPPEFVAKTAIWAREKGAMKDLPALLVAYLTVTDRALAEQVFFRVIDDAKMLRNFVQVVRSGVVARRSLASMPKRLVRSWLAKKSPDQLFRSSIGASPSLGDVIKMAHPRPTDAERSALYAYLAGRAYAEEALPEAARAFEGWKKRRQGPPPAVPFQMLTALELDHAEWMTIAANASWTETRMNLNTFARHGVFSSKRATRKVAERLRDRAAIRRARALPYQLMMAWKAVDSAIPPEVAGALEDAMEVALENVPAVPGRVFICPDVSGSMQQPVTGYRKGSSSKVRCVDVAALVAAAMMRVNDALVLPFEHRVVGLKLARRDSVMSNAQKLAEVGGGGTNCSAPLAQLNAEREKGSLVVLISDNESWVDARRGATALLSEWEAFHRRNPDAKLVCIDLAPNRTTQAADRKDILNVGGFSDAVFELLGDFSRERSARHWVDRIEAIEA
jgi:60 kDa SS-A/Ro ribonucleoprotein